MRPPGVRRGYTSLPVATRRATRSAISSGTSSCRKCFASTAWIGGQERYGETVVTGHFGRLEDPSSSLEDVVAVLRFFGGSEAVQGATLGCLQCNAATEQAPTPARSRETTAAHADRLTGGFVAALTHAEAAGRLVPDVDVDEVARFLTVLVLGMFVVMRAGGDPVLLRGAAAQGLARLDDVTRPGDGAARL